MSATRREPSAGFTRVTRKAVRSVIHSWPSGPQVTSQGLPRLVATTRLVNVSSPGAVVPRGFCRELTTAVAATTSRSTAAIERTR